MKVSDKPQISKKWWTSEKPADVKGAELEKALQAAEKAQADEKKKSDAASIDAFLAAIADLEAAVDKTVKKELDKKKHKDVITVLEKFYDLTSAETDRLEEAKEKLAGGGDEDAEEEETENKLLEPDYLYKMIKLMKAAARISASASDSTRKRPNRASSCSRARASRKCSSSCSSAAVTSVTAR